MALIYHCKMQRVWGKYVERKLLCVFLIKKKNECHQSVSDPKITKQLYVCMCTLKRKLLVRKQI